MSEFTATVIAYIFGGIPIVYILVESVISMYRRKKRETFYLDTCGDMYNIPRGKSSNREYRRRLMASISRPTYQPGRDIIPAGYEVTKSE